MGLKSNDYAFVRDRRQPRKEGHMKMEADWSYVATDRPRMPGDTGSWKRQGKDLPLEPPACGSAGALSLDFQPPELKNGRINLLF